MCGLAGFVDFTRKTGEGTLRSMTDCLTHRGPDASGYALFQHPLANIGLGHRRLSIIDLSPLGEQPMYTDDRQLAIVFNGEMYNYREIREELVAKGYSFRSGSDTEVILNAYREWGSNAVHRFIGMFVFIIYDAISESLFICRDRAGVKPLYYTWKNGLFVFASELKSLLLFPGLEKSIDVASLYNYLSYSFVPDPNSILKGVSKLEPGHQLTVTLKDQQVKKEIYWNIIEYYTRPKLAIDEEEATVELEARLRKACEYRMVSDVPIGLFLSGGYDSSLVAAMLQTGRSEKIKTFTIGFPEKKYDEASYARQVAQHLGTEHHELYCTYEEAKSIIPELPYYYDEPFGDSSAIPTILVSRFARKHVTVALSADGGDELFAGYERHAALMKLSAKLDAFPAIARKLLSAAIRYTPDFFRKKLSKGKNTSPDNIEKYVAFIDQRIDLVDMIDYANQSAMPDYVGQFFSQEIPGSRDPFQKNNIRQIAGKLDQLLCFDYLSYLPGDILTKVDRATMSISLEGREPLLDHRLTEWVAQLPPELKYNNGVSKFILKKIVHKYIPAEVMQRPKMGFAIPLVQWFRKDLRYLFDTHLSERNIAKHGLLNHRRLQKELADYYAGNDFTFPLLWNLLMFQLWYEKWFESGTP